jgi:hypothetical protein
MGGKLKKLIIIAGVLSHSLFLYGCDKQKNSNDFSEVTPSPVVSEVPEAVLETKKEAGAASEQDLPGEAESSPFNPTGGIGNGVSLNYVTGEGVRMRKSPSTEAEIIGYLNHGAEVVLVSGDGDWSKVEYGNSTGYVHKDYLSTSQPEPREALLPDTSDVSDTSDTLTEDVLTSPRIIVKKSERSLELWDGDTLYGSYSIGLGWSPEGDKQKEGDGRTPEGTYYVCTRNSYSSFYLSLGVSYPNKEDAVSALEAGSIDESTYRRIADAADSHTQPPWNTAMGGEIMIHGMGSGSDWTAGCVAVDNEVMDLLWKHCPMKTPITIQP